MSSAVIQRWSGRVTEAGVVSTTSVAMGPGAGGAGVSRAHAANQISATSPRPVICPCRLDRNGRALTPETVATADTSRMAPTWSISRKLGGLSILLVGVIVVALTGFFSSQHVAETNDRLTTEARTYGTLLAKLLKPAIAFDDRETAREILDSLASDSQVASAAVYTADGGTLYAIGTPGPELARLGRAGREHHQLEASERNIVVAVPIVSLEGPRGSVAVELSTQQTRANQRTATISAIGVGVIVTGFGVYAAWLIARSLVRRLRRLSAAAGRIADGALDGEPLPDRSGDELGTLTRAFNRMVEQLRESFEGVRRRTEELSVANHQLVRETAERAKVEVELRHAQKLESLGRLATGVAHELNTPIQFVSDSCAFLRTATGDLITLVQRSQELVYQLHASEIAAADALAALETVRSELDADYLETEVPAAVGRAVDGLQRMTAVVRSMKEFSHPGRKDMELADINRGLLNTIMIARHEYKYIANLTTELGELPLVSCQLGELNQVFLNLIVNAAHAIGDVVTGSDRMGEIVVRTWLDADMVKIAISDTGGGIPDAIREQIFEPFFTTKEVGKGTGQGLAIAHSIVVDRHRGQLMLDSTVGVGTTFTIVLPRITADGAALGAPR
jgi:signal transduction histidine kinase